MKGLIFEALSPRAEAAPNRMDVACFIGFARTRGIETPTALQQWLQQEGWWATDTAVAARPGVALSRVNADCRSSGITRSRVSSKRRCSLLSRSSI